MPSMSGTPQLAEQARQASLQHWTAATQPKVERWLTTEDVCAAAQLGEAAVRRFAREGRLKAYRVGGIPNGDYRFRESDLIAFMTMTPAKEVD